MAKQQTNSPFNQDEFQRIFDEYRTKIEEITRSTGRNLESLRVPPVEEPEPEEADVLADALESDDEDLPAEAAPAEPPARPQAVRPVEKPAPAPVPLPARPSRPVTRDDLEAHLPESERVIREARKKAQKILEEAEKQVRRDARKKTKAETEKIIAKARKEAESYAEKARQTVEQDRAASVAAARSQVETAMKEMTEQFRKQAHAKSTQIVEEAQQRADRLMQEVTSASGEISDKVKDVIERARGTIGEFEERLKAETADISQAIVETQGRIEALAMAAAEEAARLQEPANGEAPAVPPAAPTILLRVLGERSNGRNGTEPLFFGMVEMTTPSENCDYKYFKGLKRYLIGLPGIKQLQESASEKEVSALFDVTEPLPLLDLLSKIPVVDEVIGRGDRDLMVVFRT